MGGNCKLYEQKRVEETFQNGMMETNDLYEGFKMPKNVNIRKTTVQLLKMC